MKPFPYQERGAWWLASKTRAYLADPPGLGKTIQAVHAWNLLQPKNVLVLCPRSAVHVWDQHADRMGSRVDLMIQTYDILRTPSRLADTLAYQADLVVCDEAHRIRNASAGRTVAAFKVLHQAPRVWMLSGTPMPNHPGEIYAPAAMLWPELLTRFEARTYAQWLDRFCVTRESKYGLQVVGPKNLAVLKSALFEEDRMLRREIEEVAPELPPFLWDTVEVAPTVEQDSVIAKGEQELEAALEKAEAAHTWPGSIAGLRHEVGRAKAYAVAALVREELELGVYQKIVIFAHHLAVLDILQQELHPFGVLRVDGRTAPAVRVETEKLFQTSSGFRVFLGQQQSCGEAITLTAAHHVLLVEPDWTPDVNEQAAKRCHRIGQDKPVFVRRVALAGSRLDAAIERTNNRKVDTQAQLGL